MSKYRLLRLLLFVAAFGWAISVVGIVVPWRTAEVALSGLGAAPIPHDPMLDYWLRMACGAFVAMGCIFLAAAVNPRRFRPFFPFVTVLMVAQGFILLIHGLRLGLRPFPFWRDVSFCILVGVGILVLRNFVPTRK